MKSILVLALLLSTPAYAKTVNLSVGETFKIGNTKVVCGGDEEPSPAPRQVYYGCHNTVGSGFHGSRQPSLEEARRDVFSKCRNGGVDPYRMRNFENDRDRDRTCQRVADDATCGEW